MNEAKDLSTISKEEAEYLAERGGITTFDNDGNERVNNRATRRRRPPTDPKYTKATHSLKLERAKSKKAYRKAH